MLLICIYIGIGLLSGFLAGLIGLGGGIVIVPALTAVLMWKHFPQEYLMQVITATSLAAIFITMLISAWAQNKHGAIAWKTLKWFIPSMLFGVLFGVLLAKQISTQHLQTAFALFCVAIALWMLLGEGKDPSPRSLKEKVTWFLLLFGFMAGFLAGLLGIGGGVLLIPIFLFLGFNMPQASANAVGCALPTTFIGALTNLVVGWPIMHEPYLWGFIYWPAALAIGLASIISAPLGVYLCHRLPIPVIKRVFGGILLIIAWQMLPFGFHL